MIGLASMLDDGLAILLDDMLANLLDDGLAILLDDVFITLLDDGAGQSARC
jgi:hypothetical protein